MGGLDRSRAELEDGNVVVDLGPVPLGDALCNPHNVAALLLLQLHKGVEDSKVELVEEGQLVQLYLGKVQRMTCHLFTSDRRSWVKASMELLGRTLTSQQAGRLSTSILFCISLSPWDTSNLQDMAQDRL